MDLLPARSQAGRQLVGLLFYDPTLRHRRGRRAKENVGRVGLFLALFGAAAGQACVGL